MRHVFAAVLMPLFMLGVGLLAAAEQGKDKPKKTSPIEGTWTSDQDGVKAKLIFAGDKFTLTKSKDDKSIDVTGTFKLDSKSTPNTIDMTVLAAALPELEKFKGKTSLGIIKIDGDKLEWCANEPGKDGRPKLFAERDGDARYLHMKFERVKK